MRHSTSRFGFWFWFLRPSILVVAAYLLAVGASYLMSQKNEDELDRQFAEATSLADQIGTLVQPSPAFTPKQVVEMQTGALRSPNRKQGVVQCMYFASPENLLVTGPLEKFARIVRGRKFSSLSSPDAVLVGEPIYQADNARILVTAAGNGRIDAFVWVLAKQKDAPYEDCWMTDGVFPMTSSKEWDENEI